MDEEVKIVEVPQLLAKTPSVAKLLDTSEHTLRNLRSKGLGPPYHCIDGLGIRYRLDEVARWISENQPGGKLLAYIHGKASDE